MATFAALAGVKLPENDREGKPTIFDSYDMSPVSFSTGKSARKSWFYFTENELTPGAVRVGNYKAVFNLRVTTALTPAALQSIPTLAGRAPNPMSRQFPKYSTSGRIRRNGMTSS